jgi:beta-phosphoglucomutase-like phosphatase (HAD superfamily)
VSVAVTAPDLPIDAEALELLLCDADDCLFPSEPLAFEASTEVMNQFLAGLGSELRFSPDALRSRAAGRNFRAIAAELAAACGARLGEDELERWVAVERAAVIDRLREVLRPDESVLGPLRRLGERYGLAAVSSSALARLDACFAATGLADLLPEEVRVSAEDSLSVPTSKPDPAVYLEAGRRFDVAGGRALAIEDSTSGARAAVGAGFPTVGLLQFVPAGEREARAAALIEIGATVVGSWRELEVMLESRRPDLTR